MQSLWFDVPGTHQVFGGFQATLKSCPVALVASVDHKNNPTKMKILIVILATFLSNNVAFGQFFFNDESRNDFQQKPRPCFVPTGDTSFCVSLNRCPYVKDLMRNLQKPLPGDVAILLKDSFFCPKIGQNEIEICCPFESIVEPVIENKPILPDKGE